MLGYKRDWTVALALSTARAGCAQPARVDAAIGSIMTLGNTQVPLPPGDWRQIATQRNSGGKYAHGGINNNNSVNVSYALVENGKLKSLILIHTSAGVPASYISVQLCVQDSARNRTYLRDVDGGRTNDTDCVKVVKWNLDSPDERSTPLYEATYPAAAELGGVPRSALMVIFGDSLSYRFLSYQIFFFPERDGVQGDHWRVGEEGPVEKAYVDDIVGWAKKFRPAVRNGTQNLLQ